MANQLHLVHRTIALQKTKSIGSKGWYRHCLQNQPLLLKKNKEHFTLWQRTFITENLDSHVELNLRRNATNLGIYERETLAEINQTSTTREHRVTRGQDDPNTASAINKISQYK